MVGAQDKEDKGRDHIQNPYRVTYAHRIRSYGIKRNSLGVYCTFLYAKNQSLSIWAEFFTTDIFLVSKLLKGLKTKLIGGGRARYGREDGNSIQDSYDVKEHLKIKSFGMKRNSLEVSSIFAPL